MQYGSGITMGQAFAMDKERIKHALKGELMCGETEEGFEYAPATKEECDRYILSTFDNAVYHCRQANAGGVVLEGFLNRAGVNINLREYMEAVETEYRKYECDYEYEPEEGEQHEPKRATKMTLIANRKGDDQA